MSKTIKDQVFAAEMKLLDQIITWLITHEGSSVSEIADQMMILKQQVTARWEAK